MIKIVKKKKKKKSMQLKYASHFIWKIFKKYIKLKIYISEDIFRYIFSRFNKFLQIYKKYKNKKSIYIYITFSSGNINDLFN